MGWPKTQDSPRICIPRVSSLSESAATDLMATSGDILSFLFLFLFFLILQIASQTSHT